MNLVVDANILVGELLRTKGRRLIADRRLELFIAAKAWEEAEHELRRRVTIIVERGQFSEGAAAEVLESAAILAEKQLTMYREIEYGHFKQEALARIPRDPDDWHSVALALTMKADIWTQDKDFLGCGVATWTSDTLRAKLGIM